MIYADNAATTQISDSVLGKVLPYLQEQYGNAFSRYSLGAKAKRAVEQARRQVAMAIGADPAEVIFTSSGSESNSWVFRGIVEMFSAERIHIITSTIEHPSVLNTCRALEARDVEITYLPIDGQGCVSIGDVKSAVKQNTKLISIMLANNEIGTIQPIAEIGQYIKKRGILFHTDAVQAVGHIPVDVKNLQVDFLTASAHKFNGAKGTGILYKRLGVELSPLVFGGKQEHGLRAGTENVAGIVAAGYALEENIIDMEESAKRLQAMANTTALEICAKIPGLQINSNAENCLPGMVNIGFPVVSGEALMNLLDLKGICVSTSSACSSGENTPSHVLMALGQTDEQAKSAIRISYGRFNTEKDAKMIIASVCEAYSKIRGACNLSVPAGESFETAVQFQTASILQSSSTESKIDLFLSLFRGREDAYAKRWYSPKTEKSGYSPVCLNEWERGICDKRKIKCNVCPNRNLRKLDKKAIYQHLEGKHPSGADVLGLYPMTADECCCFLAIDFDDDGWQKDVSAFRLSCDEIGLSVAVERSRSGNGAHIWFFFADKIPASTARKFGSALLTHAMTRRHEIKFNSYDRLFPNQDTIPSGGFGNLIALPLQGLARRDGNSLFVDENFTPYPDQWAFLSCVNKLELAQVESYIKRLCGDTDLGVLASSQDDENAETPWRKSVFETLSNLDFPTELRIVEANMLYIEKEAVSQKALNRIKRLAAFKNPEFYKAQAMRFPTWDKPRIISISDETERYLCLPRGCKDELTQMLAELNVSVNWQDEQNIGRSIDISFNGILRDEQAEALEKLLDYNNGILSATTAFGKTVVSAALIAAHKINTLVLVNRQPLLDQWKTRLTEFLSINEELPEPEKKRGRKKERSIIGRLSGGKNALGGIIDIAVIQSLVRGNEVKDIVKNYGMVIVDECHHVSAVSFERVLKEVNAKYVYGLTATPKRQDGHQPIIYMHCGQIRYKDDAKLQAQRRPFDHFVIPRFTSFRIPIEKDDTPLQIQELYNEICQSETRNNLIADDVIHAVEEGRIPLVLTERKAHVELLENAIKDKIPNVITFVGGQSAKNRNKLIEKIAGISVDQPFVIVATGKYVGEGFDVPRLDTLFLAMPIAWQGTLAQYAGRLHRLHDDKREVRVYDYVDVRVAVLDRMYAKRVKGYSSIGYKTKSDVSLPDTGNIIFDGSSFLPVFTTDLLSVKREAVIVSPYVTKARLTKMLQTLDSVIISGAKCTIVTRPPTDYAEKDRLRIAQMIDLLRKHGAVVIERSKIHQKFAVIDSRTAWYGSINLLSFGSSEESIMRLESKGIAEELLKSLVISGFHK